MKRNVFIRILCTLLCAVMLLGVSQTMIASAYPATAGTPASVQKVNPDPSLLQSSFDFLFYNFGLIGFIYDPYQFTIINQKPVFQWGLGFNNLYDVFPWVVNVWADSIRCTFNYEGKDWLIQLWKGGYGVFLATGGEIGIYIKSPNLTIEHYNASTSQDDWLNLRYTMYNRGKELYTRPSPYMSKDVGPYWWAPGYRILSICTDFFSNPRTNVVMDGTIELKDNAMAKLFIEALKSKGFKALKKGATIGIDTPETYYLESDKKSVRFVWQNLNEGFF